jgi:predicted DNA-binding transcriptional regulator AlpA
MPGGWGPRQERKDAVPHRGRRNADEKLLLALAGGATTESAAQQAGLSARTVYRRLADSAFRQRLQQARDDMVQSAAGVLTAAPLEAVRTLMALQQPSFPPAVRLGAARAVLELGMKLREEADLTARLEALEAKVRGDS